jgi:hypothetical protein
MCSRDVVSLLEVNTLHAAVDHLIFECFDDSTNRSIDVICPARFAPGQCLAIDEPGDYLRIEQIVLNLLMRPNVQRHAPCFCFC